MTAAYNYLGDLSLRVHADAKALEVTRENIARLKDRIASDQSNLDAAEQYEKVLTKAIAAGQQILDEEWHEDWQVNRPPGEQAIEHLAHAATDRTKSFPVVQLAKPVDVDADVVVCDWADCGQELTYADDRLWLHIRSGRAECKPEPPESGGIQQGTDGDPTRRTVLPPHIAAEVRTDG